MKRPDSLTFIHAARPNATRRPHRQAMMLAAITLLGAMALGMWSPRVVAQADPSGDAAGGSLTSPVGADRNAGADAAGDTDADADANVQRLSFLEMLGKGGWFMLPLGACSLLGMAIAIERFFALRRSRVSPDGYVDQVAGAYGRKAETAAALEYCRVNDCPVGRILAAALRRLPRGEEAVEAAIADAGAVEVAGLRRNFRLLYGVSTVAPMIGLVGTVWGMIQAFQVASSQGLGQAEKLAEGIYIALITTFAGMLIAIPVLIFYFYFLSRIEVLVSRLNDDSVRFLEKLFGEHQVDHPIHARPESQPHTHPHHDATGDRAPAAH